MTNLVKYSIMFENSSGCRVIGSIQIMWISVVFSLLWNFTSCGIMTHEPLQDNPDLRKNLLTTESLHMDSFPMKPVDGDRKTLEPSGLNKNAMKSTDWYSLVAKDWHRLPLKSTESETDGIESEEVPQVGHKLVPVIIPTIITGIIMLVCIANVHKHIKAREDVSITGIVLQPPPQTITSNSNVGIQVPLTTEAPVASATDDFVPSVLNTYSRGTARDSAATDKPPEYSKVITGDYTTGPIKFPGVTSSSSEAPPPKYDEENMKK